MRLNKRQFHRNLKSNRESICWIFSFIERTWEDIKRSRVVIKKNPFDIEESNAVIKKSPVDIEETNDMIKKLLIE